MSDEFWVSIFSVQAMDNVSTLIDLCKYSHPFARVLTHSDESTYIFRLHGWHDRCTFPATAFPLKRNELSPGDRSDSKKSIFFGITLNSLCTVRTYRDNLDRSFELFFQEGEVGVFLETAHPAKFLETVEGIIGEQVEIPSKLQAFMKGTKQSIPMTKDFASFKAYLME